MYLYYKTKTMLLERIDKIKTVLDKISTEFDKEAFNSKSQRESAYWYDLSEKLDCIVRDLGKKQQEHTEQSLARLISETITNVLSERKVMKVGGSRQEMPMPEMPQDAPVSMEEPVSNNAEGNVEQGSNKQSVFDTNFDAGVEADEDTDPKKYIQQLTGKLSQTLQSFSTENGGADPELCKYVANMITVQAAKGLSEEDKKDVIKKINMSKTDAEAEGDVAPAEKEDAQLQECKGMSKAQFMQLVKEAEVAECGSSKKINKKNYPFVFKK